MRELGQKWTVIATFFEARSDVNLKNHWASMVSRWERVERFTQEKVVAQEQVFIDEAFEELIDADFMSEGLDGRDGDDDIF